MTLDERIEQLERELTMLRGIKNTPEDAASWLIVFTYGEVMDKRMSYTDAATYASRFLGHSIATWTWRMRIRRWALRYGHPAGKWQRRASA